MSFPLIKALLVGLEILSDEQFPASPQTNQDTWLWQIFLHEGSILPRPFINFGNFASCQVSLTRTEYLLPTYLWSR